MSRRLHLTVFDLNRLLDWCFFVHRHRGRPEGGGVGLSLWFTASLRDCGSSLQDFSAPSRRPSACDRELETEIGKAATFPAVPDLVEPILCVAELKLGPQIAFGHTTKVPEQPSPILSAVLNTTDCRPYGPLMFDLYPLVGAKKCSKVVLIWIG